MTDPTQTRCGAKKSGGPNKGKPCKSWAVKGRNRCRLHGGNTPRGQASPHYKHGRYSKVLPERLRESYEEAANDPDLLRLKSEIALAETRRQDLMSQLDKGSYDDFVVNVGTLQKSLRDAIGAGDMGRIRKASESLGALLDDNRPDRSVWKDLIEIEDHKRKLVESERKRYVELGQLLTVEASLLLMKQLSDIVKTRVKDVSIMRIIISDVLKLQENFN